MDEFEKPKSWRRWWQHLYETTPDRDQFTVLTGLTIVVVFFSSCSVATELISGVAHVASGTAEVEAKLQAEQDKVKSYQGRLSACQEKLEGTE